MAALETVEWEPCLVGRGEPNDIVPAARRFWGFVPEYFRYLSPCPWVSRSMLQLDTLHIGLVHTDPELVEFVALAVSQDNSCRYCYAAHRTYLRVVGMDDDRIRRLEQELLTGRLTGQERPALEFVRRVSRSDPPPSRADRERLAVAGYGAAAVGELALVAALYVYFNRVATLTALPPQWLEQVMDRWWLRLCRPLLRWWVGGRRRGPAAPAASGPPSGPFAYIAQALPGVPAAAALGATIHDAWTTGALEPRARALVFAVVARAVGASRMEREAAGLLCARGFTEAQIESILDHLGAPELDPIERLVVPYARETVRYTPAHIQRRGRTLCEPLGPAAFLDLVGTASLANALARLSLALGGE
jgi:AhpD family alkylhydroperoxidase